MRVSKIRKAQIDQFYRERFSAHSPTTIRRHQRSLSAVFNFAVEDELIDHVPFFSKPKIKKKKGRNMNKKFLIGEAELIIDCAQPHLKPILAVLLSTGARVGMTLKLLKEHFILVRTRGRVSFLDSKNGNAYRRPLHDYTIQILKEWLKIRNDTRPEMFLTPKNQPFVIPKGRGGQIKGSYNKARDKAVRILTQQGSLDRARVIAKSTPHWFRHNIANTLRQDKKADVKTIMEAGMWESEKVLLDNYFGDTHEQTDAVVKSIPIGTKLTQNDIEQS
ncbi:MAG: tyrosine-type recombinase/integrase [Halopseudomonas aestusnigri]